MEIKKLRIVWFLLVELGGFGSVLEEGIKVLKFKWFLEDDVCKMEVLEDVDLDLKKLWWFLFLKERSCLFMVVVFF